MRFYEFEYIEKAVDKISGEVRLYDRREWFGSERDAVVRRLALHNSGKLAAKKSAFPIDAHDIPTDKTGLLRWLRENVV